MSTIVLAQATKLAETLGVSGDGNALVETLKATAFRGQVSDSQMAALLIVANQYGLSPWTKEIYAFPDNKNGIVPVVGVDGWSRIINSHPMFDGMDFELDDKEGTCTIHRKDRAHPIRVTEYMDECKRDTGPWKSHPRRMLRHKAMIQCARLAFGFVGIYDQDEAERIIEGEARVISTSRPGVAAVQRTLPADSPERDLLIADMFAVADNGMESLMKEWERIGKEKRKLIADQLQALKDRAAEADKAVTDAATVEAE